MKTLYDNIKESLLDDEDVQLDKLDKNLLLNIFLKRYNEGHPRINFINTNNIVSSHYFPITEHDLERFEDENGDGFFDYLSKLTTQFRFHFNTNGPIKIDIFSNKQVVIKDVNFGMCDILEFDRGIFNLKNITVNSRSIICGTLTLKNLSEITNLYTGNIYLDIHKSPIGKKLYSLFKKSTEDCIKYWEEHILPKLKMKSKSIDKVCIKFDSTRSRVVLKRYNNNWIIELD